MGLQTRKFFTIIYVCGQALASGINFFLKFGKFGLRYLPRVFTTSGLINRAKRLFYVVKKKATQSKRSHSRALYWCI